MPIQMGSVLGDYRVQGNGVVMLAQRSVEGSSWSIAEGKLLNLHEKEGKAACRIIQCCWSLI